MPTKCDRCGEEVYIIYITKEYERICDECRDELKEENESLR